MTFYRRVHNKSRLPRGIQEALASTYGTISAEGNAILCFPPDGTFFRGLLTHSDVNVKQNVHEDAPYALYGRETPTPGQYKVTVADLDTGSQYHLNCVKLRGQLRKSTSESPEVTKSVAIPIAQSRLFSIENSPSNYDNLFMNESCPTAFHEFGHDLSIRSKMTEMIPEELPSCSGSQENNFDDENVICSSLSDVIIGDSSPSEGKKPTSGSLSDTTSSSRASSVSPSQDAMAKHTPNPQFSLEAEEKDSGNTLRFTANSVFRGQKAEMMIQQFLAGSKLMGAQYVVLVGPLSFSVRDMPLHKGNMAWSF